jgi:hypothetical protein
MTQAPNPELKKKILAKLTGPTLCALGTLTDDGKPWVRYVTPFADSGIYSPGRTTPTMRSARSRRIELNTSPWAWFPRRSGRHNIANCLI